MECDVTLPILSASPHIYTSWHTRGSFHNRNILFGVSKIHTMIRILVSDSLCLFCVLLTLHLTNVIAYHIECIFPKNSEVGVVSGISGIEEFNDFLIRCGDKDTEILRYTECYIGQLSLPVRKILNNYPSLRIILWNCDGLCTYSIDQCNQEYYPSIQGCDMGKYSLPTVKFALL